MKMDRDIDHYAVLGLPSGEEGTKLTEDQISKAYKSKCLELHPDKRPDDPNANFNFHKLKTSYDILKDEKKKKLFDDLVRRKHKDNKPGRQTQEQDSKRRKMKSDLEKRERAAFDSESAIAEEERTYRKLQEDITRIKSRESAKEKVVKVSWKKKVGEDYSAERLREIFGEFGRVEDVVIKISKKKGSALVVLDTRDAVVAAVTRKVVGDVSNPLLVLPLKRLQWYQNFENSVLEKMLKVTSSKLCL